MLSKDRWFVASYVSCELIYVAAQRSVVLYGEAGTVILLSYVRVLEYHQRLTLMGTRMERPRAGGNGPSIWDAA